MQQTFLLRQASQGLSLRDLYLRPWLAADVSGSLAVVGEAAVGRAAGATDMTMTGLMSS